MKEALENIGKSIFSIFTLITLIGGGVVFIMFIIALIIGGDTATFLSLMAKNTVMPMFIRSAAVAVLCGLITYYTSGNHDLTMNDNK
jgi:hypothetical protein